MNTILKPAYVIPVNDTKYYLYRVHCSRNIVIFTCPQLFGCQYFINECKRTVKAIVPPIKGIEKDYRILFLQLKICKAFHAKIVV